MKVIALLLASCLSSMALAQSNVSTGAMPKMKNILSGVYVGVDYMNITDVKISYSLKGNNGGTSSGTNNSGTSLGAIGVRVGYDKTPIQGFGFAGGVRYLESMNTSESGPSKIQILIPEFNGTLAANSFFAVFAGLNYSKFVAPSFISKDNTGQLGMQFGFTGRFTKNIAANIGYTMINQKYDKKEYWGSQSNDVRYGGFTTSMNYIF
jgi:hypothetical protein